MKKQAFQHGEIRDQNDTILQDGAYGKKTAFTNGQNMGILDYIINNLEVLYDGLLTVGLVIYDEEGRLVLPDEIKVALQSYVTSAGNSATAADASAQAAADSAAAADASAKAVAGSEANADSSAKAAATAEANADSSAKAAATAEKNSLENANAAADSKAAADASAQAAASSATQAAASAETAGNSAASATSADASASNSASAAASSATAAAGSASEAASSATAAAGSASEAASSATAAAGSASEAASSATAAADSATAAKASEDYSASVASGLQTLIIIKNTPMNHNAIFSRRNLGTVALGDIDQFVSKYVNNGNFGDIYVGDYITIQDGTYNAQWVAKHFDPRLFKGDTPLETHHIGFTPMTYAGTARMNATNVTTGGYAGSEMHTTTLPALWSKLQSVLGSHLLKHRVLLSNSVNTSAASMAGAGWTGASNGWAWYDSYGELMSEVEIYGCTVFSSSFYDVGEACEKLAYYNFVNHCYDGRVDRWLRAVTSGTNFAVAGNYGIANRWGASNVVGVCPLILIG